MHSGRWSEPILLRRKAVGLSDEDQTSNSVDSGVSDRSRSNTHLNLVENHLCSGFTTKKKSGLRLKSSIRNLHQKLELTVSNCQIEEAKASDRHNVLKDNLRTTESLLNAFSHYIECLVITDKAAEQLLCNVHIFLNKNFNIAPSEYLQGLLKTVCQFGFSQKLGSIKDKLNVNIIKSNDLIRLEDEFDRKQRDFYLSSKNFSQLLVNSKLDLHQLEKLRNQYDSIVVGYQHSRRLLDQELNRIIEKKKCIISESTAELHLEMINIIQQYKGFLELFSRLSEELPHKSKATGAFVYKERALAPCKKCFCTCSRNSNGFSA